MMRRKIIAMTLVFGVSLAAPVAQSAGSCTGASCGTKSKQDATPGTAAALATKHPAVKKKVRTTAHSAGNCTVANCGTKAKQEAMPGTAAKMAADHPAMEKKVRSAARTLGKGRGEYTAAERARILENARDVCKKSYGAPSTVYSIDYKRRLVTCVPPGA